MNRQSPCLGRRQGLSKLLSPNLLLLLYTSLLRLFGQCTAWTTTSYGKSCLSRQRGTKVPIYHHVHRLVRQRQALSLSSEGTMSSSRMMLLLQQRRRRPELMALYSSSSSFTERDQETLDLVRQAVNEANGTDAWRESIDFLSDFMNADAAAADATGNTHHQAELSLAEAFGWKRWVLSSATLRKYQTPPIVPTIDALRETTDWLRQGPLQLQDDPTLLQTCINKHAPLYLKDPQTLYRRAIQSAPRAYRDAATFRTLIQKDPTVLDVFYNCGDEDDGCASNCGNCWVTYQRRL